MFLAASRVKWLDRCYQRPMRIVVRNSFEPSPITNPDIAVFFDVIRASTTLLSLIHVGASKVYSANDEETCRTFHGQGYELISEVFHGGIDNSPTLVLAGNYAGKPAIHKSTNLTAAVFHNRHCKRALIGGFANASQVAAYVKGTGAETVELVAASNFLKKVESVEDVAGALTVQAMIEGRFDGKVPRGDELEAKVRGKEARQPPLPPHFLKDLRLVTQVDRFPYVLEAKPVHERLMEIVRL